MFFIQCYCPALGVIKWVEDISRGIFKSEFQDKFTVVRLARQDEKVMGVLVGLMWVDIEYEK